MNRVLIQDYELRNRLVLPTPDCKKLSSVNAFEYFLFLVLIGTLEKGYSIALAKYEYFALAASIARRMMVLCKKVELKLPSF